MGARILWGIVVCLAVVGLGVRCAAALSCSSRYEEAELTFIGATVDGLDVEDDPYEGFDLEISTDGFGTVSQVCFRARGMGPGTGGSRCLRRSP